MSAPLDSVPAELASRVEAWIATDPDPQTRDELRALLAAGDAAALTARFAQPLRFGTAGLRAPLGAGPARMNRAVVRQVTGGLCRVLRERGPAAVAAGIVVGYDARHGSATFAADVADVAAAAGLRARVFSRPLPTPITAFAVRHLGAAAGVMVTASHNPAADNGYKVYAADGAQIVPPDDGAISAAAEAGPPPVGRGGRVEEIDEDALLGAYRTHVLALLDPDGPRTAHLVYTPLHGVGGALVPALLVAAGFPAPELVGAQAAPDPDFPTVPFPNPEEPGALDLALAQAATAGADAVVANDPDADRLALAVRDEETGLWRPLSGDELGILLAEQRLARTAGSAGRLVATTIVSSSLLAALASEQNVDYAETLTGFKWIARAARGRPGTRLVFGYEEALGYAVSDAVADKDGISAALVAAEMVAAARAAGRPLLARLDDIEARLGVHVTAQWSLRLEGATAAEEMASLVAAWRASPPAALAGDPVSAVRDLAAGDGGLPPTDALVLVLGEHGRIVLRPSGTEPKLKAYFEARSAPPGPAGLSAARAAARERVAAWTAAVAERCRR